MAKKQTRKPNAKGRPTREPSKASERPSGKSPASSAPSTVSKGTWVKWSGRQWKILDEQAQRYGIPLAGETIDLAAVAVWIHDLLATHGRRILAGDAASEIYSEDEPTSPALERKREVEYQLRLRDLAERDGQLVSRDKAREGLAAIAGIFRHYGDQVQRQFGADALDLFNDTLADMERAVEQLFTDEKTAEDAKDAKGTDECD